jgi:hypothetical protein
MTNTKNTGVQKWTRGRRDTRNVTKNRSQEVIQKEGQAGNLHWQESTQKNILPDFRLATSIKYTMTSYKAQELKKYCL